MDTIDTIDLRAAARALKEHFGAFVEAPYIPGKTMFRDLLWEVWSLSESEAEELCDSLEEARMIRFEPSEVEAPSWTIDPEVDEA